MKLVLTISHVYISGRSADVKALKEVDMEGKTSGRLEEITSRTKIWFISFFSGRNPQITPSKKGHCSLVD